MPLIGKKINSTGLDNKKGTTLHFSEYLEKIPKIFFGFCTHQSQYILSTCMSIHARFSSDFSSYSGSIWRMLKQTYLIYFLFI